MAGYGSGDAMTTVLRDAEYAQLTDIQRAQYWANRFQDAEERIVKLQAENKALRAVVDAVRESVIRIQGT